MRSIFRSSSANRSRRGDRGVDRRAAIRLARSQPTHRRRRVGAVDQPTQREARLESFRSRHASRLGALLEHAQPAVVNSQGLCKDANATVPSSGRRADHVRARSRQHRARRSLALSKLDLSREGLGELQAQGNRGHRRRRIRSIRARPRALDAQARRPRHRQHRARVQRRRSRAGRSRSRSSAASRIRRASTKRRGKRSSTRRPFRTRAPRIQARGPQPVFGLDQIFGAEIQAGRDSARRAHDEHGVPESMRAERVHTGPASAVPGRVVQPGASATTTSVIATTTNVAQVARLALRHGHDSPSASRRDGRASDRISRRWESSAASISSARSSTAKGIDPRPISPTSVTAPRSTRRTPARSRRRHDDRRVQGLSKLLSRRRRASTRRSVAAFSQVSYSAPPTIESITQDNMLGNFNVCVDWRARSNRRRTEQEVTCLRPGNLHWTRASRTRNCDRWRQPHAPDAQHAGQTDYVVDGLLGTQYEFENRRSHLYATVGARQDWLGLHGSRRHVHPAAASSRTTLEKAITKNVAIEFLGRHRVRYERGDNIGSRRGRRSAWVEGENYTGLSIAPKWIFTQGIEYSTRNLADEHDLRRHQRLSGVALFEPRCDVQVHQRLEHPRLRRAAARRVEMHQRHVSRLPRIRRRAGRAYAKILGWRFSCAFFIFRWRCSL